ncbi:MAG: Septum site-determining protein MinD [Pelotomaculum sp. PtaU1.Bin035]|nr:MAG: Septum site-determining protein MinD [Pelotomaculum sp. PtaU1.Bin035]
MKEIVIVSGKGGTGKTSVAASLVALAERLVVADCDVDAADLHLVLEPHIKKTEDFTGGKSAGIVPGRCSNCGKCHEICRFNAVIKDESKQPAYFIDHVACEGCGVCSYFCPGKAIDFKPSVNGQWFISDTRYGPMVHARLGIAAENSGKLVSLVRDQAKIIAEKDNLPYIIVDGPPGIGCPVISSVTGADAVLIVTEPTVSGGHDLERVAELAKHFKIPTFLCINKYDINPEIAKNIEEKTEANGIAVIGRIHYDKAVTEAQIKGLPVVAFQDSAAARDMRTIWENLESVLG